MTGTFPVDLPTDDRPTGDQGAARGRAEVCKGSKRQRARNGEGVKLEDTAGRYSPNMPPLRCFLIIIIAIVLPPR